MAAKHFDVLVIGAGISGISAAYHLQKYCPNKTFAILEGRKNIGGTWDLFRFPGIRSDSEMYTLGFSFRPYTGGKSIADGESILNYLKDTVKEFGIEKYIYFGYRVEKANWSSETATWTIKAKNVETNEIETFTCNFFQACTGYYNYEQGYTPHFEGRDQFQGTVVHPQHWQEDLDIKGKRVAVIGSGATAITLIPALAKEASHVTMVQRSPTYIVAGPDKDAFATFFGRFLPFKTAYNIARWKNIFMSNFTYWLARRYPKTMKKLMLKGVEKELGKDYPVEKHFTPNYNPWDQRVCLAPNGDIFQAIKEGNASVVTDHIESFTETGILMKSGTEVEADIIVTATGLQLLILGNIGISMDGEEINVNQTVFYKSTLFSNIPNFAFAMGYTNLSWSLKCDLVSMYVCRLLNYMEEHGYNYVCPRQEDETLELGPFTDFTSGYFQRSMDQLPKQGNKGPWTVKQSFLFDRKRLGKAPIEDGALEFKRVEKKSNKEAEAAAAAMEEHLKDVLEYSSKLKKEN